MFASKLKVGMESLVQELGDSTETQQQFEAMLKEISKITEPESKRSPAATTKAVPTSTASVPGEKTNFQDTISQTMNRLNESKQEIDKSVLESADDDFLAKMMKDLESAMGSGDGSDMDMSKLINEMLEQMASKEILYEPMKEMYDKYPAWMEENEKKISPDDRSRYLNQYRIISDVVTRFEKPGYSDGNEVDRKYITGLMEQMQSSGAPPPELMGDLASGSIPGLDMGADGLPKVPGDLDGCATQ
jgi:peroxin-19